MLRCAAPPRLATCQQSCRLRRRWGASCVGADWKTTAIVGRLCRDRRWLGTVRFRARPASRSNHMVLAARRVHPERVTSLEISPNGCRDEGSAIAVPSCPRSTSPITDGSRDGRNYADSCSSSIRKPGSPRPHCRRSGSARVLASRRSFGKTRGSNPTAARWRSGTVDGSALGSGFVACEELDPGLRSVTGYCSAHVGHQMLQSGRIAGEFKTVRERRRPLGAVLPSSSTSAKPAPSCTSERVAGGAEETAIRSSYPLEQTPTSG